MKKIVSLMLIALSVTMQSSQLSAMDTPDNNDVPNNPVPSLVDLSLKCLVDTINVYARDYKYPVPEFVATYKVLLNQGSYSDDILDMMKQAFFESYFSHKYLTPEMLLEKLSKMCADDEFTRLTDITSESELGMYLAQALKKQGLFLETFVSSFEGANILLLAVHNPNISGRVIRIICYAAGSNVHQFVSMPNPHGVRVLDWVESFGSISMFQEILNFPGVKAKDLVSFYNPRSVFSTLLHRAAELARIDIIKAIFNVPGFDIKGFVALPNNIGKTALEVAENELAYAFSMQAEMAALDTTNLNSEAIALHKKLAGKERVNNLQEIIALLRHYMEQN